ncbi:20077_t:CDS:2, partial [Rhizophagus irregularis]
NILPQGLDDEIILYFLNLNPPNPPNPPNPEPSNNVLPLRILAAKYNHDFYNEYECKTSNSFIFSLTNRAIPTLSRVSSIIWCKNKGPCFGLRDLWIQNDSPLNNIVGKSKRRSYEKKIINRENFKIEEYEVFQIIDSRTVHKLPLLHSQTPI